MAFAPVFGQLFPATFSRAAAASAVPWWYVAGKTCVAAYQPKGAASLAASYVNLANPGTYDAAPGVAPAFNAATGWTFDGTSQYLKSGVIPASNYTMLIRYDNQSDNQYICGQYTANARFEIRPNAGQVIYYSGTGVTGVPPALTAGVLGIAANQGYRNGTADGAIMASWTTTATSDIYIGARSGIFGVSALRVQAFAIYSDTLTSGEVAAVSAAMAAL